MIADLKPYPEYKSSGQPWIGDIPRGWQTRRLKSLTQFKNGIAFKPQDWGDSGHPIIRIQNLNGSNRFNYTRMTGLPDDLKVEPGDLLFSWSGNRGTSFGPFIWNRNFSGYLNQHIFKLVGYSLERRYFAYVLRAVTAHIEEERTHGIIGLVHVTKPELGAVPVPLAPTEEQSAIVRFLDHANAQIQGAIRAKKKLIALLNEQKQAIIHRAVTRGLDPNVPVKPSGIPWLGDIPHHWGVKRLKFVVNDYGPGIQMGPFGSSLTDLRSSDTGFKLFGQENTISGDFTRGSRWITKRQFEQLSKYELIAGDIALTRKGSIGKARLIPETIPRGIADSDTIRVRLDGRRVNPLFIVTLLHSAGYVQRQLIATQRGAVLGGLNTATIGNLQLILPPQAEQSAVLNGLLEETRKVVQAVERVEREIELLFEYRTRLVADIVTGRLDVRDVAAGLSKQPLLTPDALKDADELDEVELLEEESTA